jgi:HAE1 family hydrophobic/amphiphilic exporter-1
VHVSALAVRRPIATTMLVLAAALLGAVALPRLEVALLPDVRASSLTVWVGWPEAGVPEIEETVARPCEDVLLTAAGVRAVRTRVVAGGASFEVELHPGTDPDAAALAVRERLDAVRWLFPDAVDRPLVLGGVGEDAPAMVLALAQDDLVAAADWAESVLAPRLEQIDGLARALVVGAPDPEIRIEPDPSKLEATGIDVGTIAAAVRDANADPPGGVLRRRGIRYALHVDSRLVTAADVAAVEVARPGQPPVRVGDLARVRETFADADGWSRLDGDPAVGVLLYREAGANLLRVAGRVREELDRLREEYPQLAVAVIVDSSPFVRQSIGGVWQAVWLGGVLAFGVLFAFLRDRRSPVFLVATLPVAVIVTFAALDLLGISLNLLSLGGIALGVGMLVDNGIVVLENISRHRASGAAPAEAAARGAREVSLPILASTLTTCAVFVPLAWVPGAIGQLFRDQAVAVSVSLLVSLATGLTLLPMLCAKFPPPVGAHVPRPGFGVYHALLERFLERPGRSLLATAAVLGVAAVVLARLPREVLPPVATDHLELTLELPPGSDVTATDDAVRAVEARLAGRPEVESVFSTVGNVGTIDPGADSRRVNRAVVRVALTPAGVRHRDRLSDFVLGAFAAEPWRLTVGEGAPELAAVFRSGATLTCDVSGPDEERAEELARAIAAAASEEIPFDEAHPLRVVAAEREPQLRLVPREDNLRRFGLTEAEILPAVQAATSGYEATRIRRFDEEHPVVVRLPGQRDPEAERLVAGGRSLPLGELFRTARTLVPAVIHRENQARVASVRWDGPLRRVSGVRRALESAAARADLPAGYAVTFGGAHREMQQTLSAVARSFLLSAGLVLLVLAAQFESVRLPVVIFASVPLALVGVTAALLLTRGTVNALSGIGLVVLVGIVVNDAILKVDLLRRLRDQGMPRREAILTAGMHRYRPILMTTLTTALGLAPLFFGRGAELRAPLAAVLIGGLLSSTFLTLLVVPVLFDRIAGRSAS